jgi:DNA invertase Pin-like site-specific DNA recombinase
VTLVGYARVSTENQTTDPQVTALRKAGCSAIFRESASGAASSRPELARALAALKSGDVLVVTKIDRLARSLSHLLEVVEELRRRSVGLRSLGDPIDTTGPAGMLTLQILGAVAQFERELIRERTRSGLAAARLRGRAGGNPGLTRGDQAAVRKLSAARAQRRSAAVIAAADGFLSVVQQNRPRLTWDQIVRILNHRGVCSPKGAQWTRDSLIRAMKCLVDDGVADPGLLAPTPRGAESDRHVGLVAAIEASLPKPTLSSIARKLEEMREPTPRGGFRWSASSVKNLLDRHHRSLKASKGEA